MHTWNLPCDRLGILSISSILPQILPQTSSQTQGKQRVSRMEHQTPSVFPGNFRKRKVLGTLCFPFCLPEKYMQANPATKKSLRLRRALALLVPRAQSISRRRSLSPFRRLIFQQSDGLPGTSSDARPAEDACVMPHAVECAQRTDGKRRQGKEDKRLVKLSSRRSIAVTNHSRQESR